MMQTAPEIVSFAFLCFSLLTCSPGQKTDDYPHPENNPQSPLMLAGEWVSQDSRQIDFFNLPKIPSEHRIISDAQPYNGVNQHNYLVHYNGKFWAMWSDGPGVEDRAGQRVAYATSSDGLSWSERNYITPYPPRSAPGSEVYNTRSDKGYRYISRGFWIREGALLALVSLDEAGKFFGPGLTLHAFRFNEESGVWNDLGSVCENTINNFPPKLLPSGEWMMTRRTHNRDIFMLIGGVHAFNQWQSIPVVRYQQGDFIAEEPYWWVLPDGNLMALFRDNARGGYLYRAFSTDNGHTWSRPVQTNFPDARSKFNGLQLRDGRFILVSNPNPQKRDPLALAVSQDGMVFTRMGYLIGGRRVDYPHVIEHQGHLLIAFSGAKQSVEVLKIKISVLDKLQMPDEPIRQ